MRRQEYEKIWQPVPTQEQISRWQSQEKQTFQFFYDNIATMFQAEKATGIMRPSICRFVGRWKSQGLIRVVRIDKDPLTQRIAQFLSTNPTSWPRGQPTQLAMFQ